MAHPVLQHCDSWALVQRLAPCASHSRTASVQLAAKPLMLCLGGTPLLRPCVRPHTDRHPFPLAQQRTAAA